MSITSQYVTTNPCLNADLPLGIDEACFSIVNDYNESVTLYSCASECYLVCTRYI